MIRTYRNRFAVGVHRGINDYSTFGGNVTLPTTVTTPGPACSAVGNGRAVVASTIIAVKSKLPELPKRLV